MKYVTPQPPSLAAATFSRTQIALFCARLLRTVKKEFLKENNEIRVEFFPNVFSCLVCLFVLRFVLNFLFRFIFHFFFIHLTSYSPLVLRKPLLISSSFFLSFSLLSFCFIMSSSLISYFFSFLLFRHLSSLPFPSLGLYSTLLFSALLCSALFSSDSTLSMSSVNDSKLISLSSSSRLLSSTFFFIPISVFIQPTFTSLNCSLSTSYATFLSLRVLRCC